MDASTVKSVKDIMEINQEIAEMQAILNTFPFDTEKARNKVDEINCKHPENIGVYKLIYKPSGPSISVAQANPTGLIADLNWKITYLQAKAAGKSIDELIKELRKNPGPGYKSEEEMYCGPHEI